MPHVPAVRMVLRRTVPHARYYSTATGGGGGSARTSAFRHGSGYSSASWSSWALAAGIAAVGAGAAVYTAFHYMSDKAMFYSTQYASDAKNSTVGAREVRTGDEFQRSKAVLTLRAHANQEKVSCAAVASIAVEQFFNLAGEWGAGHIGDHYANQIGHLLVLPPTDANLRQMAHVETAFWNTADGSALGAAVDESRRFGMLQEARTVWEASLNESELARWNSAKAA